MDTGMEGWTDGLTDGGVNDRNEDEETPELSINYVKKQTGDNYH